MKIEHKLIPIGEIAKGYVDNQDNGVIALSGKLNVRPPYQREFVYNDRQRDAVINTIKKKLPLNVMYWAKNDDGSYEILDGQQRTISFCQYINSIFSIDGIGIHNLTKEEQEEFLDYKVDIYICEGSDRERLNWFETINTAGEKLTYQELLNINYTGTWLAAAKKIFSKTNCAAYKLAHKYVDGTPIRQEYLETALSWVSGGKAADYMSKHQQDKDANELWNYFLSVIDWVKNTFPEKYYRKEMLGLNWGDLYSRYKDTKYDPISLEANISELMEDDEVTNKKGIYEYVLSGKDVSIANKLSKRKFSNSQKREAYERQKGICPKCGKHFSIEEMEGDHITPWHLGGKTTVENLQMLCKDCNRKKGGN